MSRWIDADELGASVIKNTVFDKGDVIKLIEDAPTIEIIRCKECRYFYTEERFGETVHFCKHFNDVRGYWAKIYADDFCSYGERKESE